MKGGQLARLAGQLCQRADFQPFCHAGNADEAAEVYRRTCDITGRAKLGHDSKAARTFQDRVRRPFVEKRSWATTSTASGTTTRPRRT